MENRKSSVTLEPLCNILNFTIPYLQRGLVEEHINDMVNDQRNEYDKHGCFSMLQSITVGCYGKGIYVLDGQHRIKAFERLKKIGYPISGVILPVIKYNIDSNEELVEYFNRINKHMPIHPFEMESAWMDYGKEFCDLFQKEFKIYVKLGRCNCPHISIVNLKTHLAARNIQNILVENRYNVCDLWHLCLKINSYIGEHAEKQIDGNLISKINSCKLKMEKCKEKCNVCYLGIWRHFEWLDIAIKALRDKKEPDFTIIQTCKVEKKPIPAVIRQQVWKKHTPNIVDDGVCYVCDNPLKYTDMECGHIIARALGGEDTKENLMPICKMCNRDMGIMNLYDYKNMISNTNMDIDS